MRIGNDIYLWRRYRQSHETWLAISEVKANDVKNLNIGISKNIPRYYEKINLIDYSGLKIVNDINRWRWCHHSQRTWLVGPIWATKFISIGIPFQVLGEKCYNGILDGEWLVVLMKCGLTSWRNYSFGLKETDIDWKLWNKMGGGNYLMISKTMNLKALDRNCKDLW